MVVIAAVLHDTFVMVIDAIVVTILVTCITVPVFVLTTLIPLVLLLFLSVLGLPL